jgi:4-amino-4-deoxy-L-arabinose transferase-like glycosyltransferase
MMRAMPILLVVALALVGRLALVATLSDYRPATDSVDFDRHAVSIARFGSYPSSVVAPGGGPTAFRPPGYPLALAAVYRVVGTGDAKARWRAGLVLQALLGTLVVALLALVATRLWGPRAGVASGALAAAYPPFLLMGSSLMSEPLFLVFELAALLAALAHRRRGQGVGWAVAAGVLGAAAALTRSNGAVLLLPLALLVWTGRPRLSRTGLTAPAALVAAAVLTLVPWTVRNAVVLDAFVPISTQTGTALAGIYNPTSPHVPRYPAVWQPPETVPALRPILADRRLEEPALSRRLRRFATTYVRDHPGYVAEVGYWNLRRTLGLQGPGYERIVARFVGFDTDLATAGVYAFWLAAAAVLAGAFTLAARRAPPALWLAPLLLVLSSVFINGQARYRIPADPFLLMLAALAALAVADRVRRSRA